MTHALDELLPVDPEATEATEPGPDQPYAIHEYIKRKSAEEFLTYVGNLYRQLEAEREGVKAKMARLVKAFEDELHYYDTRLGNIENAISMVIPPVTGEEYVANEQVSMYYSPSVETVIDEPEMVPIEYTEVKTVPVKSSIKEAILAGKTVPGAHLAKKFNLRIGPGGRRAVDNAKKRTISRQKKDRELSQTVTVDNVT